MGSITCHSDPTIKAGVGLSNKCSSPAVEVASAEVGARTCPRRTSLPDLMAKVLGGVKDHEVKSSSVPRLEVIRKEEVGVLAGCGSTAKLVEGGARVRIYVTPPPPERQSDLYLESNFDGEGEVARDAAINEDQVPAEVDCQGSQGEGIGARRDHSDSGLGEELGLGRQEVQALSSAAGEDMNGNRSTAAKGVGISGQERPVPASPSSPRRTSIDEGIYMQSS